MQTLPWSVLVGHYRVKSILAFTSVLLLLLLYSSSWQRSSDTYVFSETDNVLEHNVTVVLPTRPALVAAARATEDVTWMQEVVINYDLYPYNVDERNAPEYLSIPINKGHEAMVYLTYIINEYDRLPPYTVFVHGHKESWHQEGNIVHLVNALQIPALEKAGYVPLRCDWYPSCPAEINPLTKDGIVWGPGVHRQDAEDAIGQVWSRFFPGVEIPHTIASQCCAQFAVTRDAIRGRPKEQYITMRDWLTETTLHDDISGRVLEKLWAYIMTNEPVHCPSPYSCACNYFGHCQLQKWPKPPIGLGKLPEDSIVP